MRLIGINLNRNKKRRKRRAKEDTTYHLWKFNTMVEFDGSDDANTELLAKLKHLDVRVESADKSEGGLLKTGCWKSLKWKATLNHIGLLVSLSIYCGVGGLVSVSIQQFIHPINN